MSAKHPSPADAEVGRRIRTYRLEKGLSQTALGNQLGVTFQQLQKYEKGINRVGAGRLQKIAEILGVSVSAFFSEQDALQQDSQSISLLQTGQQLKMAKAFSQIASIEARQHLIGLAEVLAANA